MLTDSTPYPSSAALLRDRISTRLQRVIGMANGTVDGDSDTITLLDGHNKNGTVMNQRETVWGDKVTVDKVSGGSRSATIVGGNKSTVHLSTPLGKDEEAAAQAQAPVEIKTWARCDDGATLLVDGKAVTINRRVKTLTNPSEQTKAKQDTFEKKNDTVRSSSTPRTGRRTTRTCRPSSGTSAGSRPVSSSSATRSAFATRWSTRELPGWSGWSRPI